MGLRHVTLRVASKRSHARRVRSELPCTRAKTGSASAKAGTRTRMIVKVRSFACWTIHAPGLLHGRFLPAARMLRLAQTPKQWADLIQCKLNAGRLNHFSVEGDGCGDECSKNAYTIQAQTPSSSFREAFTDPPSEIDRPWSMFGRHPLALAEFGVLPKLLRGDSVTNFKVSVRRPAWLGAV